MSLRLALCVVVAGVVSPLAAEAADWLLMGHGTASCGTWIADTTDFASKNADRAWVLGFLSGVNFSDRIGYIGKGTDAKGIFVWIDRYCKNNPMKTISSAATALVDEWDKTR